MITIEEIYKQAEFGQNKYGYDDDMKQDIVIHIWLNKDKYDPSKGTKNTWMNTLVKFFFINDKILRKVKTTPLSYFEFDKDDYTFNLLETKMIANELSPIDELIHQEEQEEFTKSIESLPSVKKEIINNYIDDGVKPKTKTEQQQLRRIIKSLNEKEKEFKFFLINIETKKELFFNTLTEISEYLDLKTSTVSAAYRDKRIFKKKWRIIQK